MTAATNIGGLFRLSFVSVLRDDYVVNRDELLKRIWIDPARCGGKPCIRGTRIWVSLILDLLASGMTADAVLAEYPHLKHEDILACIAYGSEIAREHYVLVPLERG